MKILNIKKEDVNWSKVENSMKGTYFLLDENNDVVYVGKATCVKSRIQSHKKNKDFSNVVIIETDTAENAKTLETIYLNINLPLLNSICPEYNDIPLWALRYQIMDLENNISKNITEMLIEIKSDLRSDYEKFIRLELNSIFEKYKNDLN